MLINTLCEVEEGWRGEERAEGGVLTSSSDLISHGLNVNNNPDLTFLPATDDGGCGTVQGRSQIFERRVGRGKEF